MMDRLELATVGMAALAICGSCNAADQTAEKHPVKIENASITDVIPLADGGAFAVGSGEGLWYVKGGIAVRVKEVPAGSGSASIAEPNSWLFAWATHEHQKRRKLGATTEAEPEETE
jgi:hypothetical protein